MKQVYDNLYVGDVNDADNPKKQEQNNIQYILNLSGSGPERDSAPGYDTVKEKHYIHIPLADDETNPDFIVKTAIELADKLHRKAMEEDESLLIHCSVGASRSVSIAAAIMSLRNHKRVEENISRIKKVRVAANPHPELSSQVNRITAEIFQDGE